MSDQSDPQKQISEWLNMPADYGKGLALYEKYGSSAFYKKLLAARVDEFNVGKLRELLLSLTPALSNGEGGKSIMSPHPGPLQGERGVNPDKKKDNERYLGLIRKKGDLYTVLNMLMGKRLFLPEGEELRKCAVDILITNQKLMECWAEIDHYQDNGSFASPQPSPEGEGVTVQPVGKQLQYLRQSISKCRKRLKSDTCRDRPGTEKLLSAQTEKLKELLAARKGVAA